MRYRPHNFLDFVLQEIVVENLNKIEADRRKREKELKRQRRREKKESKKQAALQKKPNKNQVQTPAPDKAEELQPQEPQIIEASTETHYKSKSDARWFWVLLPFIVIPLALAIFLNMPGFNNKVYIPANSDDLLGMQVEEVVAVFEKASFTNIKTVASKTLTYEQCNLKNSVSQVTVDNQSSFTTQTRIGKNKTVYITYLLPMEVAIPTTIFETKKIDYETVYTELLNAGFGNIQLVAEGDIVTGWIYTDGQLDKIEINEKKAKNGTLYPIDTEIVIKYHSKVSTD